MEPAKAEIRRLPLVEARALSIEVAGQLLLREADFEVGRGELVVLVGASGTGKTVLLKLLSGIHRPDQELLRCSGTLRLDGEDLLLRAPRRGRVGILFQDHALLDELTALGNVRFAARHRPRGQGPVPSPLELLLHLGVDPRARLRVMSGGQLQRLALARTLALAPELILYDEPTTGLDPGNARRAARLIQRTHEEGRQTSLVVTHDIQTLLPIADRVLLLNPATRKVERVEPADVESRLLHVDEARTPLQEAVLLAAAGRSLPRRFLEGTSDMLAAVGVSLAHLLPWFPRIGYGLRYLLHGLKLTASTGAFLYLGIAGVILGYVATYFTFEHLPKRGFTEPLFIEDILRALGYLLYRVLCPVLVTLLVAARTGAAIASDVGNKVYARQFDALRSFGVQPSRYLLTASLWATLVSMPLLLLVSFCAARVVSQFVFIFAHPEKSYFYWDQNFHRSLRVAGELWWRGSGWLLLKVELCAFGIAAIAYFQGAREKMAANDVSGAVTRTIIWASLYVLLVHFGLAFLEF